MTVIDWLLDAGPSVRWQVMQGLTGAPAEAVAAAGRPSRWITLRVLRWHEQTGS